jgi:heat shock protein HspQ
MSTNDTGWISLSPQGQPGMPPAPQAAPPAQNQPAQKLSQDDTGWLPTTPQLAIQAPVKPQSTKEVDRIMGPQTMAGQLFERQQKLGPSPETVGAVKEIGRNTLDALKGAVQSFNPKPQDVSEAEAFKTAGIGGMLIYRMAASLGHPLLDANKVAAAIHDINQSKDPVGTYLEFARETASQGAGQGILALATEGVRTGVPAAVKGIGKQLPVGMDTAVTSQGAEIPVRGKTFGAKVAGQLVSPEVPERIAQEKTAPAVQKAVGDVLGKATGSKAETILSPETGDSFGVRGHATSLIGEATPVMDRIDELSGNKLSDAQAEAKAAKAKNDWEGVNAARAKQQALFDQYRDQLSNENLDVDTAVGKYRKAMRLDEIATAFERAIDKDTGDLSGKKLSNEIGKMVAKGPKKSPLLSIDFTQDHISALREVADIMKGQETIPTPIIYSTLRAAAAFLGVERSGFSGLAENVIGERLLEAGGRRLANRIWADALAEPAAAPKLVAGLKNGDIQSVVAELAKEDPSWRDKISQRLSELWHSTTGEAGLPGTVKPNIEEAPKPLTLHHWSNEDITETDPEKFGTGKAGAERAREKEPGFLKRTYFADESYKEPAIQGQKYHYTTQVDPTKFYDIAKDPEGLWQKGLREGGPTAAENAVHDAGYTGYQHDGGYVSFEKHAVVKQNAGPHPFAEMRAEHLDKGGATFDKNGKNLAGTDAWSVGAYPDRTENVSDADFTPDRISAFAEKNKDLLAKKNHALGSWKDTDNGNNVLDVTKLIKDDAEAKTAGAAANQKAIYHLKRGELADTGGTGEVPVAVNASGESAASLEAQSRLKSQQARGLRMFDVDSRMAGSKAGWHPIPPTVDAVNQQAQPFHHIVSIDKDGHVAIINSGENARPLPTDEHVRQLTRKQTRL